MCGLLGILAGNRQKRRVKDIEALTDVFTMMLLLSEHRGPHACMKLFGGPLSSTNQP